MRSQKAKYCRNRYVLRLLDEGTRSVVLETARLEDATPEAIIAQWVGERAAWEAEQKERAA